jgi:molybdopterin/thiamine biosynthesis adenylyltransferase
LVIAKTRFERPSPVLGAVVGVIGSLQAVECIKIVLGLKGILYGRMLQYDGFSASFDTVEIDRDMMCKAHKLV